MGALVDPPSVGRYRADVLASTGRLRLLYAFVGSIEADVGDKAVEGVASVHTALSVRVPPRCSARGALMQFCVARRMHE